MNMPYSRFGFGSIESAETINSFAVITDTNTAVLSCDYIAAVSVFSLYENVSIIKEQAYDTVYSGLCYGGGQYYSFDTRDNALVMLDKDFQIEKVLKNKHINKERLFVMKDKNQYTGIYDIKEPCFNDLYEIFMNGGINEPPFWSDEFQADIINYQKGLMTLEEVTANLQERPKWLYLNKMKNKMPAVQLAF